MRLKAENADKYFEMIIECKFSHGMNVDNLNYDF
jgi:hypothetical protein